MIIDTMREDIPVVIIRPPAVEGTCKEPFPGWIEGHKSIDPIVSVYGKGKLKGFPGIADNVIDIVPVDMVVNETLAAMTRHGVTRKVDINIYHVSSSISNPLTLQDLCQLFYQHFKSLPCIGANGKHINIQKLKIFASMEEFDAHLLREATTNSSDMNPSGKIETRKFIELAKYLAKVYKPFTFYHYSVQVDICGLYERKLKKLNPTTQNITCDIGVLYKFIGGLANIIALVYDSFSLSSSTFFWDAYISISYIPIIRYILHQITARFSTNNTQKLLESTSEVEKEKFGFDVKSIDWKHYIVYVHIPGLRRYVMKEKGVSKL
ncbi:Enhancer of rudimentary - like 2 [Theobroma cacao]|nr:Enhancer of rudimentary - like 2 [Theobroma cacao]